MVKIFNFTIACGESHSNFQRKSGVEQLFFPYHNLSDIGQSLSETNFGKSQVIVEKPIRRKNCRF